MADRREVLAGLLLSLGGSAALAQASAQTLEASLAPGAALQFHTPSEHALIRLMADTIIPTTDTPGALDAGVPAYLDAMMANWASDATKASHRAALAAIDARLSASAGGPFAEAASAQRLAAMQALDADAFGHGYREPLSAQYRGLKQLIAQAYYATEIGATQDLQYALVPGEWRNDAPLSEIGRTWAE